MAETFISELETVAEEVSRWGANYVKTIIDALAPDGRPFGTEKKSIEEQLEEYRLIRNDVTQWSMWISNKAGIIANNMTASGIDPEQQMVINPLDIAIRFALDYSIRMERLLNERMVQ